MLPKGVDMLEEESCIIIELIFIDLLQNVTTKVQKLKILIESDRAQSSDTKVDVTKELAGFATIKTSLATTINGGKGVAVCATCLLEQKKPKIKDSTNASRTSKLVEGRNP